MLFTSVSAVTVALSTLASAAPTQQPRGLSPFSSLNIFPKKDLSNLDKRQIFPTSSNSSSASTPTSSSSAAVDAYIASASLTDAELTFFCQQNSTLTSPRKAGAFWGSQNFSSVTQVALIPLNLTSNASYTPSFDSYVLANLTKVNDYGYGFFEIPAGPMFDGTIGVLAANVTDPYFYSGTRHINSICLLNTLPLSTVSTFT